MDDINNHFHIRELKRGDVREYWLTSSQSHKKGVKIIGECFDILKELDAKAVSVFLFSNWENQKDIKKYFNTNDFIICPHLLLFQKNSKRSQFPQIQVHAVNSKNCKNITFENKIVGKEFEDANARYFNFNAVPDHGPAPKEYEQVKYVFERSQKILKSKGLDFSNTVRTWLFADEILSWYGELNKARNVFFQKHDIFNKIVPASTGIGISNTYDRVIASQFLAFQPKNDSVKIEKANSPLQCPALDYKSSFSRAIKVTAPDHKRLYISGTASIDEHGETVFKGDAEAQVNMTMKVVNAILEDAKMSWEDTKSSLVYFKYKNDFGLFDEYCMKNGIELPHIKIEADVCRDELLFEIELSAIRKTLR